MKKILVLNCGSSSVKYELVNMVNSKILARGLIDRVGMEGAVINHHYASGDDYKDIKNVKNIASPREGIQEIIELLQDKDYGVIDNINEIYGIGHRVVHGGERYTESAFVDEEVKSDIKHCIELAPLHNPHHLVGIEACEKLIPEHPQVVVFDTAFHQTMPEKAYMYALPYEMYKKYGIRKYGFHGTSHQYVSERAAQIIGRKFSEMNIISCHLGNGSSVCAVKNGKSIDTSMGFTPLSGLIMGTRTGDFDPAVILYIMAKEAMSVSEVNSLINRHSGLYGISGVSRDFREIIEECIEGNKRAQLAVDMFVYKIKHFIGAYFAKMNGCDAIVFTAGIGENSPQLREMVCSDLDCFGIKINKDLNKSCIAEECIISSEDSDIAVLCVPTNEELLIARETERIISARKNA